MSAEAQPDVIRPEVDFIDYLLFPLFVIAFLSVLLFFDVLGRIAFWVGGRRWLKRGVVPLLSFSLLQVLKIVGARVRFQGMPRVNSDTPYLIVSNHQSLFDIPTIGYFLAKCVPQYIAKIELGKWLPATSFSLRNSGDVLIDRGNSGQALKVIVRMGRRLNEENTSAVLFPEGTRARDGLMKQFKVSGFEALLKSAPRAKVIPVTIDGSWKIQCYPKGPIPRGIEIRVVVGELIDPERFSDRAEVIAATEASIRQTLQALRENRLPPPLPPPPSAGEAEGRG